MSDIYLIIAYLVIVAVSLAALLRLARRLKLTKEVTVAVIAAVGTILASVFTISYTNYNAKIRAIKESNRVLKVDVYSEFGELVFSMLERYKEAELKGITTEEERHAYMLESQDKLNTKFWSLNKKLILWGSPEVIQAWTNFKTSSAGNGSQSVGELDGGVRAMLAIDEVFRAMRTDLELSNKGLRRGDLLKVFLNDPENLDRLLGR